MKVVHIQDKNVEPVKKVKRVKLSKDPVMLSWAKREIVKHFVDGTVSYKHKKTHRMRQQANLNLITI